MATIRRLALSVVAFFGLYQANAFMPAMPSSQGVVTRGGKCIAMLRQGGVRGKLLVVWGKAKACLNVREHTYISTATTTTMRWHLY